MADFEVDPSVLAESAGHAQRAGEALRTAGACPAPNGRIFGALLSHATDFTYPAATAGVEHFASALAAGDGDLATRLRGSAEGYRAVEERAIGAIKGVGADGQP